MTAHLSWTGYDRLSSKLAQLQNPDATDLMQTWQRILKEGNRRGMLEGTDKDGLPLRPVTYRGQGRSLTRAESGRHIKRQPLGAFKGLGSTGGSLAHGNLRSSEYRLLTGPPLAPRYDHSRTITNYVTRYVKLTAATGTQWVVEAGWADVVSVRGVEFLPAHFRGSGRLPRRDIAGIRPADMRLLNQATNRWIADLMRVV